MKQGIHPEYMQTKVRCNGCGIEFDTRSTLPEITVEICSNCHPFYTGKQKLVDTAGRVDKFKARQEAAKKMQTSKSATKAEEGLMDEIKDDLEESTVDMPEDEETKTEEDSEPKHDDEDEVEADDDEDDDDESEA